MDVIILAAGLSTRYNSDKPKYLLYDYSGTMMIYHVAAPYIARGDRVHIVVLKEHLDKFRVKDHFENVFRKELYDGKTFNVVFLEALTKGPAHTVYETLKSLKLDNTDTPFLVKDCDNFWDVLTEEDEKWPNQVYTSELTNDVRNPVSKSYVITNKENVVIKIVEKQVVSSQFCCGGYKFGSAAKYSENFLELEKSFAGEIFVSHVIERMNGVFVATPVTGLVDLGTQEDWDNWNDKPTIFCDIDGTLVVSKDRLSYYIETEAHPETLSLMREKLARGCQIIFTTARPNKDYDVTRKLLDDLGFEECMLITGLHNAPRILINDYNVSTNRYPAATAYNVLRDSDTLPEMFR